jgi:hypothetical protein
MALFGNQLPEQLVELLHVFEREIVLNSQIRPKNSGSIFVLKVKSAAYICLQKGPCSVKRLRSQKSEKTAVA